MHWYMQIFAKYKSSQFVYGGMKGPALQPDILIDPVSSPRCISGYEDCEYQLTDVADWSGNVGGRVTCALCQRAKFSVK